MNLHNYKKAPDYKVIQWLEKSIELTPYQKSKLIQSDLVRLAPLEFMERRKRVESFWWRISALFMPIVWLLLFSSLPINFLITGRWGYKYERIKWYDQWRTNVGL